MNINRPVLLKFQVLPAIHSQSSATTTSGQLPLVPFLKGADDRVEAHLAWSHLSYKSWNPKSTPRDSAGMIQLWKILGVQPLAPKTCGDMVHVWNGYGDMVHVLFFNAAMPFPQRWPLWEKCSILFGDPYPQPPGIPFKPPGQRQVTFFMGISWSKAKARCHCWLFSKLLITALNITTSGLKDSWIVHNTSHERRSLSLPQDWPYWPLKTFCTSCIYYTILYLSVYIYILYI